MPLLFQCQIWEEEGQGHVHGGNVRLATFNQIVAHFTVLPYSVCFIPEIFSAIEPVGL